MNAFRRVIAIARIELLRLLHLRIAFTLLLMVPALQVLLFGFAIRPNDATIGIAIAAPSASSAALLEGVIADTPGVIILSSSRELGTAEAMVQEGRALIGIEMTAQSPLRIIVDATNPALTSAAVPRIEASYWQALAGGAIAAGNIQLPRIERLYNPDSRADWSFLPSLIGVTTMISMVMLGALSLAREREVGTWEMLLMLPVSPLQAFAGKLLPYTAIGTLQGLFVLAAGVLLFDLPLRGSVGALIGLMPIFVSAHFALGYAIAARAKTQFGGLQGAVAFYLPAMLLSGFLYPFETLPRWAQLLGNMFPLTHFIRAARGALLQGSDAMAVLTHSLPILAFLCAVLVLALLAHTQRLD